jgi:hypothetical protein
MSDGRGGMGVCVCEREGDEQVSAKRRVRTGSSSGSSGRSRGERESARERGKEREKITGTCGKRAKRAKDREGRACVRARACIVLRRR